MTELLLSLANRFNKLKPRERFFIVGAAAAALFLVVDTAVLGPQAKRKKALAAQQETQAIELANMNAELTLVRRKLAEGGVPKEVAQLEAIKRSIAEADAMVGQVGAGGADLGALVTQMITASPGLTLVSLSTLPTVPIYEGGGPPPAPGAAPAPGPRRLSVYRQGVKVAIRGNYLALLPYLERLRQFPQRLFWADTTLTVVEYPDSVMQLTLYTLSDRPGAPLG